jgi:UDP-GlcNAc:undecaprenyl-phosphate GlcNAc-1-phosphate transferase
MSWASNGIWTFALPFAGALLLSLVVTPLVRRIALRFGVVATPAADRWHRRTVPLLGGFAVLIPTLLTVVVFGVSEVTAMVAGASTLVFTLGLIDDLASLKPATKLSVELILACGVVALGYKLRWTGSPAVNSLITIVWIVGLTNAFNLLDNMDGLCAGISAIAAVSLCSSGTNLGHYGVVYAAALAGAAVGFLRYNFQPATIFLGDCGSLFLGSTFALLTLSDAPKGQRGLISTLVVPVLILMLPIFDTTFVTISRKLSGRAASQGGRDHTSHRLVALGFTERHATIFLYTLAGAGGLVAAGLARSNVESFGLGGLLLVSLALLAIQLAKVRVYTEDELGRLPARALTPLLVEVTYKRRIFEVILDVCLISVAYYLAWVLRFTDNFRPVYHDLFVVSLPIAIASQIAGLFIGGVYKGVWRYITVGDLLVYLRGVLAGSAIMVITLVYTFRFTHYSRSVFIINAMLVGGLVVGSRLSFRWLGDTAARSRSTGLRALICGAGDGGALLVRELRNNLSYQCVPIGFLDDDSTKQHRSVMGLPVLGTTDDIDRVLERQAPDVVIVSSEKFQLSTLARLQVACLHAGTPLKQMQFRLTDVAVAEPVLAVSAHATGASPTADRVHVRG